MSDFDLPEMRRIHWAQAQPIEREALVATAEILELNSWLEDDLKCEVTHEAIECTVAVTHRAWSCTVPPRNVCSSAAHHVIDSLDRVTCKGCKLPARKCWRVVPV